MNVFDYFFEHTSGLKKDFILGNRETISFQQLYSDSLCLARKIREMWGENNNIIILSENSVFFTTVYLAVMKSGNVCIPLNPVIESNSFDSILEKTEAKYVFISKRFGKKFEDYKLEFFDNDFVSKVLADDHQQETEVDIEFDTDRLAEIIFTSGSSGTQKGVMITHKNIIANTTSIVEYLKLTAEDTIEVVMPFYYCYGLSLLHTHLRVGGSVVFNNSFVFIGSVINDLNKYNCTGFAGVPSHFQILLRKTKDFKTTKFESLKYVTQAGGKLHKAFIKEFVEAFPDINFVVMYGQTEATARLSYLDPELVIDKLGSIGKAIPGVTLKVVDADGNEIQPGETGEIIAKGHNIMKGYFKDEEETAQTLKDDWLHTGDVGTIDVDGFIYLQSRKKEILKVRGIRISPKEIEEVIVDYPGVIDCTIQAENDDVEGEMIKAIVFINDGDKESISAEDIKAYCAKSLALHKVPAKVEFQTRLSFNAAGKKSKF